MWKTAASSESKDVWAGHGTGRRLKLAPGGLGNNAFTEWFLGQNIWQLVSLPVTPDVRITLNPPAFSENLSDKKHLDGIRE